MTTATFITAISKLKSAEILRDNAAVLRRHPLAPAEPAGAVLSSCFAVKMFARCPGRSDVFFAALSFLSVLSILR